ncbi:MAG TPA: hypothetical protein VGF13_03965 [Verrucomicrobiae bacterium]|jgi:hypothetical protein
MRKTGITLVTSHTSEYVGASSGDDPESVAKPSIYTRTLQKAAERLGGERALARYLKVPMPDLFAWMRPGSIPPPAAVFLRAVDVVLDDLETLEQERAQRVRVAAIHQKWGEPEKSG